MSENQKGFAAFLAKKDIVFSAKRYGIDALGAMAQGLFASLLIGTILKTLGQQLGVAILVDIGTFAQAVTGPAMAVSIGYALKCPPLVLFSLIAVGGAANQLGGAGGPLAVFVVTIFAAEFGKLVSKETKVDIIVTPSVTICIGVLLSMWWAPSIGAGGKRSRQRHQVGNGAAALLHGDSGFRYRRHRADAPHQQCGNLCGSGSDRLGRRCGSCRLLCADGSALPL